MSASYAKMWGMETTTYEEGANDVDTEEATPSQPQAPVLKGLSEPMCVHSKMPTPRSPQQTLGGGKP